MNSDQLIELRPVHPLNARVRMTVIVSGRSMAVRKVLSMKASAPMEVTLSGMVTEFSAVHP